MKVLRLLLTLFAFQSVSCADEVVTAKIGELSDALRYFVYVRNTEGGPYIEFRMVNLSTNALERYWEVNSQFLLKVDGPGVERRKEVERLFYFDFHPHRNVTAADFQIMPGDGRSYSVSLITPGVKKRVAEVLRDESPENRDMQPYGFELSEPGTYVAQLFVRRNGALIELNRLKFKYAGDRVIADDQNQIAKPAAGL